MQTGQPGTGSRAGSGPTTLTPPGAGRTPRPQRWPARRPAAGQEAVASATAAAREARNVSETATGGPVPGPARGRTSATCARKHLSADRDTGRPGAAGDHDQGHAGHVADQDGRESRSAKKPSRSSHAATDIGRRGARACWPVWRTAGCPAASGLIATASSARSWPPAPWTGTAMSRAARRRQGRQGGPQARNRREARDRRVRHDLRDQVRRTVTPATGPRAATPR